MDDVRETGATDERLSRDQRLRRRYGSSFPKADLLASDADPSEAGEAWRSWLDDQIQIQGGPVGDAQLHWSRLRLFRKGIQWISTRDRRRWREPNHTENRIRRVFNLVGPAMDFRVNMLAEQRPGWRADPIPGAGVSGREAAEAQQAVTEYYYYTGRAWLAHLMAASEAQTDGVCFLHVYIDPEEGPKGDDGKPMGDIRTDIATAFEVWADPEARSIHRQRPARWAFVRRTMALETARILTGDDQLTADDDAREPDPYNLAADITSWTGGIPPYPSHRYTLGGQRVWDFKIYLRPSRDFPKGRWFHVVGGKLVASGTLPGETIPLIPVRDGSTDPSLFPQPVATDWVADQTSVNALGSKILEYARAHSGSRLLAMEGTILKESWTDIVGSIINYQGTKPDVLNPMRASGDLWTAFREAVSMLEDKTGHNDLARGKLGGSSEAGFQDVSGRAALAAREMFERQFGPPIRASAEAGSEWAEVVVAYTRWLYRGKPRSLPATGRPDLAKKITSESLGDQTMVYMDPETLMPLPRALRNQMLFDHLQQGLISVDEYRKRAPYAEVRNLAMGDLDQWNRAQTINTTLEEGYRKLETLEPEELWSDSTGLAVLFQDDPEIHMRALNELVLDDSKPWALRRLAFTRWGIYSDLNQAKNHPPELAAAGIPAPPVPLEVVGTPPSVLQASEASRQETSFPGGTGDVPGAGGQPSAAAAPDTMPVASPAASTAAPQPLGSFGAIEASLSQ